MSKGIGGAVIVAGLVAVAGLATASVLWASGDEALERLALLFAVFASIIPGLIAALRSDQAAAQTNGSLDGRIQNAVQDALMARRSTDRFAVTHDGDGAAKISVVEHPTSPLDPDPLHVPEASPPAERHG